MTIKRTKKTRFAGMVVMLCVFSIIPVAFSADAASQSQKNSGATNPFLNAVSDFQAKLPAIFREPSPEDIGTKPVLKTHFGATSSFTSDANLTTKENNPAWLARVSGGLKLELPVGDRLYTEVGYTASYATVQGRKVHDSTISHSIDALGRYLISDATNVGLKHNIQWSNLPETVNEMFTLSTTTAELNHKFSDNLSANLGDTFQWFQDELSDEPGFINQEYIDNAVFAGVDYDATERIRLMPKFTWSQRNFAHIEGKNYNQYRYVLGSAYRLTSQTTLSGHTGYNYRRFTHGNDRGDHGVVYGVGVHSNVSKKLSWNASYNYDIQDTFDTSFLERESAEATNLDNLDRNFRVLRTHRFGGSVLYQLTERNAFRFFSDVQFARTEAEDNVVRLRDNDESSLEMGPGYSFRLNKYLSLELKYVLGRRFGNNDSDSGRTSYTFHKIGGGITATI